MTKLELARAIMRCAKKYGVDPRSVWLIWRDALGWELIA